RPASNSGVGWARLERLRETEEEEDTGADGEEDDGHVLDRHAPTSACDCSAPLTAPTLPRDAATTPDAFTMTSLSSARPPAIMGRAFYGRARGGCMRRVAVIGVG